MSTEVLITAGETRCRICQKALQAHAWYEAKVCYLAEKNSIKDIPCPVCRRKIGKHSEEEVIACARSPDCFRSRR